MGALGREEVDEEGDEAETGEEAPFVGVAPDAGANEADGDDRVRICGD